MASYVGLRPEYSLTLGFRPRGSTANSTSALSRLLPVRGLCYRPRIRFSMAN